MNHEWMLDVLTDLRAYAQKHKLQSIAEQLEDARHVAIAEFSGLNGVADSATKLEGTPDRARHAGEPRSPM
jgi:hypothetical protein